MIKKHLSTIIILAVVLSVGIYNKPVEEDLGANYDSTAKWFTIGNFDGYQTQQDPQKIADGASPIGQNTTCNDGDKVSIRTYGYELFPSGTASTTLNPIKSLHTFRKRDGSNIMMRTHADVVDAYLNGEWFTFVTGLVSGQKFGFSDYNINTDLHSYVYFGNATNTAMRWNGAYTKLTSDVGASDTTINVVSTAGFKSSGGIRLCATTTSYSSITATTITITALGKTCSTGNTVAQTVEQLTGQPKGNIYLNANNRLFIAGITATPQAVYFSKYGDATDFVGASLVTDSTADSPGIFNLGEGGGAVTGMALDENAVYIFKRSIVYRATLSDSLYVLTPLKPFDGKSQTVGAIHQGSVFAGGNGIFFITPDKQILSIERVENIDYPQTLPISKIIEPSVTTMKFDESDGIVYRNKAYFSQKSTESTSFNDIVLVYNIQTGQWENPVIGLNANVFTVYDDGTGENIYFGSSYSTNVFKISSIKQDDIFEIKANWRSKQYDFQMPHLLKDIEDIYVEGYITPNTSLTISLLLDEDGYTQTTKTTITGSDEGIIFNSDEYNVFGFSAFGSKRFGSNSDYSVKKKFRIYLTKGLRLSPFYTAQIEFASEGLNNDWEITNYGFYVRENSSFNNRNLIKEFK